MYFVEFNLLISANKNIKGLCFIQLRPTPLPKKSIVLPDPLTLMAFIINSLILLSKTYAFP